MYWIRDMRSSFGFIFMLALMAGGMNAWAQDVPRDVRAAYSRAHQCFYASGAGDGVMGREKCQKAVCAYVAAMDKYQDKPMVEDYLKEHYNNVSDQPVDKLKASCR